MIPDLGARMFSRLSAKKLFGRLLYCSVLCGIFVFPQCVLSESPSPNRAQFESTMASGKRIYERFCVACHQKNGEGQRLGAPALKKGLPNSSYITIDKPATECIDILLHGVKGTPMRAYQYVLNNQELASVITYIRNAWGNNVGDLVSSEDILLRRANENPLFEKKPVFSTRKIPLTALMIEGKKVYRTFCARCHQLDGRGQAPYGPRLIGSYVAKNNELIPFKINLLLKGAAGTRMRSYANQLTDYELASVATYIADELDNKGNQHIQPQQIRAGRELLDKIPADSTKAAQNDPSLALLMHQGETLYMGNCARCHQPDGKKGARPGIPSLTQSPVVKHGAHSAHIKVVLIGVPGSIMRSFGNRLSDFEIAAILTYQRNTFGQHKNDKVLPSEVHQQRVRLQKKIDYQNRYQLIQQDEREKMHTH